MIERLFGNSGYRVISKQDGNWIQLWTASTSVMINLYELGEAIQLVEDLKKEWELDKWVKENATGIRPNQD